VADVTDNADRLPPGQYEAKGWPVLHVAGVPDIDLATWRLRLHGAVAERRNLDLAEVKALETVERRADFHCVTKFSVFDNDWHGVPVAAVLGLVDVDDAATHVMVEAAEGYTANLPLDLLLSDEAVLAWRRDGEDLTAEHGWPLRLVVPSRYAWKSVKWVTGFELLVGDRRGFWEERGYHNDADPWAEQRYSHQE
jgi:DMSO/TMAO reductase YedYZ molybdopterin-dependent catalytic subunit